MPDVFCCGDQIHREASSSDHQKLWASARHAETLDITQKHHIRAKWGQRCSHNYIILIYWSIFIIIWCCNCRSDYEEMWCFVCSIVYRAHGNIAALSKCFWSRNSVWRGLLRSIIYFPSTWYMSVFWLCIYLFPILKLHMYRWIILSNTRNMYYIECKLFFIDFDFILTFKLKSSIF